MVSWLIHSRSINQFSGFQQFCFASHTTFPSRLHRIARKYLILPAIFLIGNGIMNPNISVPASFPRSLFSNKDTTGCSSFSKFDFCWKHWCNHVSSSFLSFPFLSLSYQKVLKSAIGQFCSQSCKVNTKGRTFLLPFSFLRTQCG